MRLFLTAALGLVPSFALAAAPPDEGVTDSRPARSDTAWPSDGLLHLFGESFEDRALRARVDGAEVALVRVGTLGAERTYRLDPAPSPGAAVEVDGPGCEGCDPFHLAFTASEPLGAGKALPSVEAAFDLYDHADFWPDGCGEDAAATVYPRLGAPSRPLGAHEWVVVTVEGAPVADVRGRALPGAWSVPARNREDDETAFCLEAWVQNATGARGPVTRTCDPCLARSSDEVPVEVPAARPDFDGGDRVGTCLPSDEYAEPEAQPVGDDTVEEPAGGCSTTRARGGLWPAFALPFLLLARRRRR